MCALSDTDDRLRKSVTVLFKPGVMDPAALSVIDAANDLGITLQSVRTFRRYYFSKRPSVDADLALRKTLANDAIEQIIVRAVDSRPPRLWEAHTEFSSSRFRSTGLTTTSLPSSAARDSSRCNAGRDAGNPGVLPQTSAATRPTSNWRRSPRPGRTLLAQDAEGPRSIYLDGDALTTTCSRRRSSPPRRKFASELGPDDWCVSVFEDNAGVVKFDDKYHVCFKVETHNHPSAIEPYGGANTGIGGVIRDRSAPASARSRSATPMSSASPRPILPPTTFPPGVLHPAMVMKASSPACAITATAWASPPSTARSASTSVTSATRSSSAATVGLIPVDKCDQSIEARRPDCRRRRSHRPRRHSRRTFSSVELTPKARIRSGGAVQIGNAITEKKLLDVILQARDRGLYHAITDCGAGGFSSRGRRDGRRDSAPTCSSTRRPLKYAGLSYTEIWI